MLKQKTKRNRKGGVPLLSARRPFVFDPESTLVECRFALRPPTSVGRTRPNRGADMRQEEGSLFTYHLVPIFCLDSRSIIDVVLGLGEMKRIEVGIDVRWDVL
jgi:hypothetical protein